MGKIIRNALNDQSHVITEKFCLSCDIIELGWVQMMML